MDWNAFHAAVREWYHIEDEKTVKTFDLGSIREITATELLYDAPDGTVGRIDLAECEANFAAANDSVSLPSGEKARCVGGRFRCRDVSFFEFFSQPHIRFAAAYHYNPLQRLAYRIGLDPLRKQRAAYRAVRTALVEHGWATVDLN